MLKRNPRRIISLGDSFHDSDGYARLAEPDRVRLAVLQRGREWIWISGNHDPELPAEIGGDVVDELSLDGLRFRHEPRAGEAQGEVAGHLHPAAKVRGNGRSVRCRAFATDGTRMVLPAFGVLAGGLNVLDRAFAPLFYGALSRAVLIGDGRLFPVALRLAQPGLSRRPLWPPEHHAGEPAGEEREHHAGEAVGEREVERGAGDALARSRPSRSSASGSRRQGAPRRGRDRR